MLLSVNYHYIEMPEFPYPGIHGISSARFLEHVSWLRKGFRLIGLPELIDIVASGNPLPQDDLCLITFDDGLKCQYEVAYKIATEHSFPISIFVSKRPISEADPTTVHKLQYIRANISSLDILEELQTYIKSHDLVVSPECISSDEAKRHYSYDNEDTARLKYYINYKMPVGDQKDFVDNLFSTIVASPKEFVSSWYMSRDEIAEVSQRTAGIGSHAVSHAPLSHLTNDEVLQEMVDSKDFLSSICQLPIDVISYPLGNENAVTEREGAYAMRAGYKAGFTMERAANATAHCPSLLARLDCNDLPIDKPISAESTLLRIPYRSRYYRETF